MMMPRTALLAIFTLLSVAAMSTVSPGCKGTESDRPIAEPTRADTHLGIRTRALRKALHGVGRIEIKYVDRRVFVGKNGRARRTEKPHHALETDPTAIRELVEGIDLVTEPDLELYCPLRLNPILSFFQGDRCVVKLGLRGCTWQANWIDGPFRGDASMSLSSFHLVAQWLAARGILGPMRKLNERSARSGS